MLLCTFGDDEETRVDQDCLVEAYRQGWLSLSGVLAPDAALCRGALYESAFAAGDLPVYDWSLYPGGAPLSDYENCLRIGAELGLCPGGADPLEIVTRSEAAALLHALQTRGLEVTEPPMLSWLSIQNDAGADLNGYLLELQSVPGLILERFRVEGWTFVVDTHTWPSWAENTACPVRGRQSRGRSGSTWRLPVRSSMSLGISWTMCWTIPQNPRAFTKRRRRLPLCFSGTTP